MFEIEESSIDVGPEAKGWSIKYTGTDPLFVYTLRGPNDITTLLLSTRGVTGSSHADPASTSKLDR